jgi:signal peptidase I
VRGWAGGALPVTSEPPKPDDEAAAAPDAAGASLTAPTTATSTENPPPGDPTDSTDRVEGDDTPPSGRTLARRIIIEWVVLIAAALAIAFVIKTFLFQAFYIPSGSMEPTLMIGDRVLVNKLSYDFHDVHRGDIVVFTAPPDARSSGIDDLVKRVIGLPGETVTARSNGGIDDVYINGRRLREPYLPQGTSTTMTSVPPGCGQPAGGQPGCVVPPGRVFVLGDNREDSKDGRVFGTIKQSSIVGRVFIKIWPLSSIGFM